MATQDDYSVNNPLAQDDLSSFSDDRHPDGPEMAEILRSVRRVLTEDAHARAERGEPELPQRAPLAEPVAPPTIPFERRASEAQATHEATVNREQVPPPQHVVAPVISPERPSLLSGARLTQLIANQRNDKPEPPQAPRATVAVQPEPPRVLLLTDPVEQELAAEEPVTAAPAPQEVPLAVVEHETQVAPVVRQDPAVIDGLFSDWLSSEAGQQRIKEEVRAALVNLLSSSG